VLDMYKSGLDDIRDQPDYLPHKICKVVYKERLE
jgi:hypothetical protein